MAVIIDGKSLAKKVIEEEKEECIELKKQGIIPKLAVIMVGDDLASKVYIKNKSKMCDEVGINYEEYLLSKDTKKEELLSLIQKLNKDKSVNGILLQSPIPKEINVNEMFKAITYIKDVDGFTPSSVGKLSIGEETFIPCTPQGIIRLLEEYKIDLTSKHVVILGRSNIVGKPLAQCCLQKNATVTICHSKTENIEKYTKMADIIISAIGKAKFIKKEMIKNDAIVIDIGINKDESGRIVGDADFEEIKDKVSYITPVPGGVGPMTVAMLIKNVIKATQMQQKEN